MIGPVYPYRGGIAQYTSMLARALIERDHNVDVISFQRQYISWLYPGRTDKDPSEDPIRTPAHFLLDPVYPWTWEKAVQHIKYFQPDILVMQWWITFWGMPYAYILRRLGNACFSAQIVHNVLPHDIRPWDRFLARIALQPSNAWICHMKREQENLTVLIPSAQALLCPLPVFTGLVAKQTNKQTARQKLNLPEDSPILLFFGLVRPYKGLDVLLEAMSSLREKDIKPQLIIAGEFWVDRNKYIEKLTTLNLKDQVHIYDHYIPDEQLDVFFSAADALVAPYTGGTQSAVVSLALAIGLPIILSNIVTEGIDEAHFDRLYIFPKGDTQALAIKIQDFLVDLPTNHYVRQPARNDWWKVAELIESITPR